MAQDQIIKCSECGTPFVWTATQQAAASAPVPVATDGDEAAAVAAATAATRPTHCPACRLLAPAEGRQRGVVKWFSRAKGYGFITPVNGPDLFVHKSALAATEPLPRAGQLVEFAAGHGPRGAQAEVVVVLQRDERDPECP